MQFMLNGLAMRMNLRIGVCMFFGFFGSISAEPVKAKRTLTESETEIIKKQVFDLSQQVHKEWSKQLDCLMSILQQLGAAIQKGNISVKNKEVAISWIMGWSRNLVEFQKVPFVADEYALLHRVGVVGNIIQYFQTQLDDKLQNLTQIAADALQPRVYPDPSFELVQRLLTNNEEALEKLQQDSLSVGLTMINKTVRTLENVADAIHLKRLLQIAALGATAYYAYPHVRRALGNNGYLPSADVDNNPHQAAVHIPVAVDANPHRVANLNDLLAVINVLGDRLRPAVANQAAVVDNDYHLSNQVLTIFGVALHREIADGIHWIWNSGTGTLKEAYVATNTYTAKWYDYLKGATSEAPSTDLFKYPKILLDDTALIGLGEAKKSLEQIADFIVDPEKYIRAGNIPDKGILITGPSRTGKTMVAQALAGTVNAEFKKRGMNTSVPFIEWTFADLKSKKLSALFAKAQQFAPCIVFIDEFHNLGVQKVGDSHLLNEFLTEMSELYKTQDPKKQVIIIAATNSPQLLERDLISHQRFGTVIRLKLPGYAERSEYFKTILPKKGVMVEDVDVESAVRQTKECSYGDLEQIVNDAYADATKNLERMQQRHMQGAIDRVKHKLIDAQMLSKQEQHVVATYQAGAVLAHRLLKLHEIFEFVTIRGVEKEIKEQSSIGSALQAAEKPKHQVFHKPDYGLLQTSSYGEQVVTATPAEKERLCKRLLAGACAQKVLDGSASSAYRVEDKKIAFDFALEIALDGLVLKDLSRKRQDAVRDDAEKMIKKFTLEVTQLLLEHKNWLVAIAKALEAHGTLDAKALDTCCIGAIA